MMAFTKYQIILCISFLSTGIMNSLGAHWVNTIWNANEDRYVFETPSYNKDTPFTYPFTLMWFMYFGEIMCLITFKFLRAFYANARKRDQSFAREDPRIIRGSQDFNPLVFLPPPILDILATSILRFGGVTKLSYAAEGRLWRGVEVWLVAYLSRRYVGRTMDKKQRRGIDFMFLGYVAIAFGASTQFDFDEKFLLPQVMLACQMVYEEKYIVSKDIPPLQAVGWEGIFGFLILGTLLIPFHFTGVEDVSKALNAIAYNWQLQIGLTVIATYFAFFNFAGLSIAKELSATHRIVLDSLRSLWIPITRNVLQMIGAFMVLLGIMYFYKINFPSRKEEQSSKNDTAHKSDDNNVV